MNELDRLIEKWEEELSLFEMLIKNNVKNKEYVVAHNHNVRIVEVRRFVSDLKQLKQSLGNV